MATNIATAKRFLNEQEVSELLGIGVATLQRWRLLGAGPRYRKFGPEKKIKRKGTDGKQSIITANGAVRYDVSDIERWVESRPVRGGKDVNHRPEPPSPRPPKNARFRRTAA